jgi:hypothetical protein
MDGRVARGGHDAQPARDAEQSTSVTEPSSSTRAKEFVLAAPIVGMRTTPGASSIARGCPMRRP